MMADQKSSLRLINKLDNDLVKKICAGEAIHRPLNVVKELIENSLDAGSTMITVTLKDGGLDQIQIQDNGCGINVSDLCFKSVLKISRNIIFFIERRP